MRVGIRKFGRRGFRECAALGRTRDLDVYRDRKPEIAYKEVGFLTDDGRVFEQQEIEQNFVERAKEMRGDAVVIMPPVKNVEAVFPPAKISAPTGVQTASSRLSLNST